MKQVLNVGDFVQVGDDSRAYIVAAIYEKSVELIFLELNDMKDDVILFGKMEDIDNVHLIDTSFINQNGTLSTTSALVKNGEAIFYNKT